MRTFICFKFSEYYVFLFKKKIFIQVDLYVVMVFQATCCFTIVQQFKQHVIWHLGK